jgi:hypothetical protein
MPPLQDDDGPELLDVPEGRAEPDPNEDNGNGPTAAELAAENDARAAALKQVAGDEADSEAEAEPGTKGQRIPKARFDEVNNERKALAEQLAQANAALAALAVGKTAPVQQQEEAPPEFDLKKAMREKLTALATGNDDRALELEEQIQEHTLKTARALARQDMEADRAQMTERQQAQALQATAADIKKVYPELDDKGPDADPDAIAFVITKRDALVAKGMLPHEALKEASEFVAKRMGFAQPETAPTKTDPTADRLVAARERNARAAAAQPPELGGRGNRATQTARQDVATMTDEEFAALPEAEKKRLRGDV